MVWLVDEFEGITNMNYCVSLFVKREGNQGVLEGFFSLPNRGKPFEIMFTKPRKYQDLIKIREQVKRKLLKGENINIKELLKQEGLLNGSNG